MCYSLLGVFVFMFQINRMSNKNLLFYSLSGGMKINNTTGTSDHQDETFDGGVQILLYIFACVLVVFAFVTNFALMLILTVKKQIRKKDIHRTCTSPQCSGYGGIHCRNILDFGPKIRSSDHVPLWNSFIRTSARDFHVPPLHVCYRS